LFKTSEKKIGELLRDVGLKQNQNVMIHSSLFVLGEMQNGIDGFHRSLIKILGKSTNILVPTFTYSFRRNEIFDLKKTPCDKNIGVYSEYIRKKENSFRSLDPMFSITGIGPDVKKILKMKSKNSFGKNSIYENIFDANIKILSIGVPYTHGISAFMHLEKLANVDYRITRRFDGYTINNKKKYKDHIYHYARKEKVFKKYKMNREKIGIMLEKNKISKKIIYHGKKIFLIDTLNFKNYVVNKLKKNPLLMLEKI
jgi:aminoglycoside 3-N-acetyltransferase